VLEIVLSTHTLGAVLGAVHRVLSFGRYEAVKELLILNMILAIVAVAIYISFA
jgi:hypothetical protein